MFIKQMLQPLLSLLVLLSFLPVSLFAQAPGTQWAYAFGGTQYDYGQSVCQTSDGGFVAFGSTLSFNTGDPGTGDLYVFKVNSAGQMLWSGVYGGSTFEYPATVLETSGGGLLLSGQTYSEGNTWDGDIYWLRLTADGQLLWSKTFSGTYYDHAHDVIETHDGGFVLAGVTRSFGAGNNDIYLIRTDAQGNELRVQTFGGQGAEAAFSIAQTADSGFVVSATSAPSGQSEEIWLIKTDSLLASEWIRTFSKTGTSVDIGLTVVAAQDGGFAVAAKSFDNGTTQMWLIKTDENGMIEWEQNLPGGLYNGTIEIGHILETTIDGGYILLTEFPTGNGDSDILITRMDAFGNLMWEQAYGGGASENGHSIRRTDDGGYIIIGETYSLGAGYSDAWLIRLQPENSVGIGDEPEIPSGFVLQQNYPNPFNPQTTIEFDLPAASVVTLDIYDMIGRHVETIYRASLSPGNHKFVWNATNADGNPVASGVYFYRLSVNGELVATKKMLLTR